MYNFLRIDDRGDYIDRAIAQGYGGMYVRDLLPDHDEIEEMLREDPAYDEWDRSLEETEGPSEEDVPL